MTFLNDNYLLESDFARTLYHGYAAKVPIIDYHCHLNPSEVYENKPFENITRLWLNDGIFGDHYKWRLLRAQGVSEDLITGDGDDFQKFIAFAGVMDSALGNPIYEWSNLELKRFFGIEKEFGLDTADEIWAEVNAKLQQDEYTPRGLIAAAGVEAFVTTDDPIDDLHYHLALSKEETRFKMLPGWRPDQITNLYKPAFNEYIKTLGEVAGVNIASFADLKVAISKRMDYFQENGCKFSDHGADRFYYHAFTEGELDEILAKRLNTGDFTQEDFEKWYTGVMTFVATEYAKRGWVMQIHASCNRDINTSALNQLGANTGFDAIADFEIAEPMAKFFDSLESLAPNGELVPRTILFSLNPSDWLPLLTIATSHLGVHQGEGVKQKFQLGAAWWFNDTYSGMLDQMTKFGEETLLGNFVGMLTDSRSFISYTRHEYFRRILCEYLGRLYQTGRITDNIAKVGKLVQDVSYWNTKNFLGF